MRIAIAAFAIACLTAAPVYAQQPEGPHIPVSVLNSTAAPFEVVECMAIGAPVPVSADTIKYTVRNRTSFRADAYKMRFRYFDHNGAVAAQEDSSWRPESGVVSGDSDSHTDYMHAGGGPNPFNSLSRATCRLQEVTFQGRTVWKYGQRWKGHLSP